ncbi:DUF2510 domain-containing protein [Actinomyces bouchesdurhonensis]|uniref:DUF2510 domain-containing protein n=1 Tax=Actinomyces bouchesdurhonensis TaxID=1852361 RepID=UPI000A0267E0|nr:DUF2510 domain-containing protein [Actinomyces bouchesdurhonensis]
MSQPVPGWYPDPAGSQRLRWWNGGQWIDQYQPMPGVTVQGAPAQHGTPTPNNQQGVPGPRFQQGVPGPQGAPQQRQQGVPGPLRADAGGFVVCECRRGAFGASELRGPS